MVEIRMIQVRRRRTVQQRACEHFECNPWTKGVDLSSSARLRGEAWLLNMMLTTCKAVAQSPINYEIYLRLSSILRRGRNYSLRLVTAENVSTDISSPLLS